MHPADLLVADPDKLGLHALGLKGGRSLLQRRFVLPFQRGLPLMSSTFTIVSSSCDLDASSARIH